MPYQTIGPRQWTLDTSAELGRQAVQPLLDDANQQQQQAAAPTQIPMPSLASSIPSLAALLSPGGADPAPQQQPQAQTAPQQQTGMLPSLDDLLRPFGMDSATRQAQAQQQAAATSAPAAAAGVGTTPRPVGASGVPQPMPTGQGPAADGPEWGPPSGNQSSTIAGTDRPSRIASAYQFARAAEQRTGVPAEVSLAFAVHESGLEDRYGPGFNYHGRQALPDEDGTPYEDWSPNGSGGQTTYAARLKKYQGPAGSFDDFADLIATGGRYRPALDRYRQTGDKAQLIRDIWAAGYGESPTGPDETVDIMHRQVSPLAGQALPAQQPRPVAPSGQPAPMPQGQGAAPPWGTYTQETLTPNQFTEGQEQGLTSDEALAICGPAAAVAFSRANGRAPTLREAKEMAQRLGLWDVGNGMHGPASQVQLLKHMGIDSRLEEGADWARIAQEVQAGRPVIVDTPLHYYVVTGYNAQTGEFQFGNSAGVLRKSGGKTMWRPEELPTLGMGAPRATIWMGAR
jgi:flagellum-specific peptidoglycan hydrolase FlgJ